mgnify:CR=1 FL=1
MVQSSFLVLMVCCYFKGFPALIFQKSELWLECSINFVNAGELVCPTYKELCGEAELVVPGQCLNGCNLNGECVDGVCKCLYGFSGKDCGIREQTLHISAYNNIIVDIGLLLNSDFHCILFRKMSRRLQQTWTLYIKRQL